MNNKNLDKVLNSFDNFEIPKADNSRKNAKPELQNLPDSQFAAEAVNYKPRPYVQSVQNNQNYVSQQNTYTQPIQQPQVIYEEPKKEVVNVEVEPPVNIQQKKRNVQIEVTKNISEYIPFSDKENGVKILSDGKIFKKKFSVKILGIGGAGNNIIKYLSTSTWPEFVDIMAINTDYNALNRLTNVKDRYIIGHEKLNGNGAGGDPKIAKEVAELDTETIKKLIAGADILLLIAGLGKGTGSGASPVIAKIANEMNILTIGLFNLPSIGAEGKRIYANALESLENLQKVCNGYTAIANDRVIGIDRERTSIKKAYDAANYYFQVIVTEFINMITVGVDVNIDFSDIKNFFKDRNGFIFLKVSVNDYSKEAIQEAIEEAIDNGYIEIDIEESGNALYNLKINENVPSIVLENSRAALKEIVKTNDLNVVQGMDFNEEHENAELNILLSGKFDLGKIEDEKTYLEPELSEPTIILPPPEPTKEIPIFPETQPIFEPITSPTSNFDFLNDKPSEPTQKIESTSSLTNIIRTEEITNNSYLSDQPSIDSVGIKVSFWKKIKNFFLRK